MVGPARHEKVGLGSTPPTLSTPNSLNIDMTVRAGSSSTYCSVSSVTLTMSVMGSPGGVSVGALVNAVHDGGQKAHSQPAHATELFPALLRTDEADYGSGWFR